MAVASVAAAIATISVAAIAIGWVAMAVAVATIAKATVDGAMRVASMDDAGRRLADNASDDAAGGRSGRSSGGRRVVGGTLVDDHESWAGGWSSVPAGAASAGINVEVGGLDANGANRREDSGFEHLAVFYDLQKWTV